MPVLARHLQDQFGAACPEGWVCQAEGRVVSREAESLLGFAPQADLVLQESGSGRRIAIELEISRADPVANHAKFAAAHLHEPFPPNHTFVSMMSRHIVPGRRNLGAQMVGVMRALGMRAFQTVLLPATAGPRIKQLNHLDAMRVQEEAPPVEAELGRVLQIALSLGSAGEGEQDELHFAANTTEVLSNIRIWNLEMQRPEIAETWKRRRCRYFARDPVTNRFAPCKFAAYLRLPGHSAAIGRGLAGLTGMSVARYQEIDQATSIFDGNRAWNHLVNHLAFEKRPVSELTDAETVSAFWRWAEGHEGVIQVADDPVLLKPPDWAF